MTANAGAADRGHLLSAADNSAEAHGSINLASNSAAGQIRPQRPFIPWRRSLPQETCPARSIGTSFGIWITAVLQDLWLEQASPLKFPYELLDRLELSASNFYL